MDGCAGDHVRGRSARVAGGNESPHDRRPDRMHRDGTPSVRGSCRPARGRYGNTFWYPQGFARTDARLTIDGRYEILPDAGRPLPKNAGPVSNHLSPAPFTTRTNCATTRGRPLPRPA